MSEKIYSLLDEIELNQLVVPEFQREFVWRLDQSQELMRSFFNEFPTGSLLFWKTTNPPAIKNKKINKEAGTVKVLLDGQQRLTTLYLLIKNKIPPYYETDDIIHDPRNLFFNLLNGEFMYYKVSEMSGKPYWMKIVDCFNEDINVVEIASKMKGNSEPMKLINDLLGNLNKIKSIKNREYPIQYLPKEANLNDAVDVFDKVNSQGTPLTEAEIALDHITSTWKLARRKLKEKIKELSEHGFDFNLDFLVRCFTGVLTGRAYYELTHDIGEKELIEGWSKLNKILDFTISHLKGMYIVSSDDLNTPNVLVPFIVYIDKFGFNISKEILKKIQRWIYLALLWRRYTSQTTQKLERDLSLINKLDPFEDLVNEILLERGRIELTGNDIERRGVSNPIYPMLRVVVKSKSAIDWSNGIPISQAIGVQFRIENHHIFPRSQLYDNRYESSDSRHSQLVNEIANRVFITSEANKDFFTELPESYLGRVEREFPGELEKQFIPRNKHLWKIENYEDFLMERRRLIAEGINDFIKTLFVDEAEIEINIDELIKQPENQYLEFKATLRYDPITQSVNKDLEKPVLKNICAFLNSNYGKLIMGVTDDNTVNGLENDYNTLGRNDRDGFENHLTNLIISKIGAFYTKFINVQFHKIMNKEICIVEINKSTKPAFYNEGTEQEFWIKIGNSSRILSVSEAHDYIQAFWGV